MNILDLNERRRRMLLPAAAVLVAVLYVLLLQPLAQKARDLEAPLDVAWRRLAKEVGRTNASQFDFTALSENLRQTQASLAALDAAERRTLARIAISDPLRDHLNTRFQLVDYQNEQQRLADELGAAAKLVPVVLASNLFNGLPQHTADVQQPELLWAALDFVQHTLQAALSNKVAAIQSVGVPVAFTNAPPPGGGLHLVEIPVEVELSGSALAVMRFLESLPLRAGEAKAAGLPQLQADKPVLFIDRLLVRRENPEKPDDVRAWVRAVGFVPRE